MSIFIGNFTKEGENRPCVSKIGKGYGWPWPKIGMLPLNFMIWSKILQEVNDLASEHPEIVQRMAEIMAKEHTAS